MRKLLTYSRYAIPSIAVSPFISWSLKWRLFLLPRVLVTETRFRLIFGFINRLRMVITINYNTVTNFHSKSTTRQSSQSIPTYLHYPFPGNGSQHRNYHSLTLQILQMNLLFTKAFFTTLSPKTQLTTAHTESSLTTNLSRLSPI
jgi:hypothetical protein